jgi:hypothetical protein
MGGKAQKAKQVKLPNGEIGIEFYDADGNKIATHAGGKKPWRNNNPGNLKGGAGAIGYDERGFAIFPDMETGMEAKAEPAWLVWKFPAKDKWIACRLPSDIADAGPHAGRA